MTIDFPSLSDSIAFSTAAAVAAAAAAAMAFSSVAPFFVCRPFIVCSNSLVAYMSSSLFSFVSGASSFFIFFAVFLPNFLFNN
ncbi:wsv304 [White spot syndrome virus]|uniref:Wsv304 n=5 Tax=White spot syndrome virus TaxID=342409 RepID=Q8VAT5_WSSVS|nr:wsv304 [Shrimp white spot syndrome virus]AFX59681.1 wsv304 [White spot syndrome virus]AAL33306.1 wsv304 [Shrimp white spot syndrome virus]AAL89228.1 WSSV360 [Shrimp white spot syndrome virus]AWQ60435.1 wsv304 [Shrimp white spot syndrome virus]AWQ60881.1 wsv304 [Shrimp white spot syndrome virus]